MIRSSEKKKLRKILVAKLAMGEGLVWQCEVSLSLFVEDR